MIAWMMKFDVPWDGVQSPSQMSSSFASPSGVGLVVEISPSFNGETVGIFVVGSIDGILVGDAVGISVGAFVG